MRRLSASLVIVAALALGACGGDDNKNDNASTTTGTTTQSTTTGTTTGKSGNGGPKKNKQSSKKGGSKSKSGSSGGSTTPSTTTKTQATPSQGTTPTPPNSPRQIAEKVCSQFLPNVIRSDLKRGKTTIQKVARNYSRGYPKDQRSQAYKGCLAGLKKI
jgi:hypothetical protein